MDPQLYSQSLDLYTADITSAALRRSLDQLGRRYDLGPFSKWDEERIAVPLTIHVELPPLGNFEDIDIREIEPVLFVFDTVEYPKVAPKVYPDRLDFPIERLSHLYVAKEGRPPAFCLIRGGATGVNEWYANKQIKDLAIRVSNWFRDGAAGTLTENADQFEPLRLDGYNGTLVYDYDELASIVGNGQSFHTDGNFSLIIFERFLGDDGEINWTFLRSVTSEKFDEAKVEVLGEALKEDNAPEKKFLYFGYLFWSEKRETYNEYDVHLPTNWAEFKAFCIRYGIEPIPLEAELVENNLNPYLSIPIVVAIKRPKPLIGYSGSLEFINFHLPLNRDQITEGKIPDTIEIKFKNHKQTLTTAKAKELSGFSGQFANFPLIIGCGSLGARIVLHLARSGDLNYFLADPATFSPHNFLRHPLSASYNGQNKAKALAKEIKQIYAGNKAGVYGAAIQGQKFLEILPDQSVFSWIFDFTASPNFLNDLAKAKLKPTTRVSKGYISDKGSLGILFFEGVERNPRADDLQALLYNLAMTDDRIHSWLSREAAAPGNASFINIGIGCHTETTVLSDDYVSLYAALFSGNIKLESTHPAQSIGKTFLFSANTDPRFTAKSKQIEFQPLTILPTINPSGWEIRMASGLLDKMRHQMAESTPHETGGVFVGCANYKTNTIHVVDLIDAPPDSQANEVCFWRGIEGLPATIQHITDRTGQQLGYIGEWHTHPRGPEGMSLTDAATVGKFLSEFRGLTTPLPVFMMILTPNNVLTFVYE